MLTNLINTPHGYYTVGNQIYLNKTEAIYKSTETKQLAKWNFHEDVYGKIDWTIRPQGNLRDLYRERAQQIRDRYDYVVVHFSGGMDSWTVLNSFLSNGIHVDEVFTRWARDERKYKDPDPNNKDESNLGSEFEYAVVPVLEHIQKNFPKTNIVIDDFSDSLQGELTEDLFFASNHYQSMPTFFRFNRKSEQELEQERKNKTVGVVYGYDKIRCTSINGDLYAYFSDCIGGTHLNPTRNVELFYWTREMPEIAVLQAHSVKDFVKEHTGFTDARVNPEKKLKYVDYREIYQRSCYPDYNLDTFQVGKALGSLVWKSDAWIAQYNPEYYKSWRWVTDQFFKTIDNQYLAKRNGMTVGLNLFNSPLYLIEKSANLPDFDLLGRSVFNT